MPKGGETNVSILVRAQAESRTHVDDVAEVLMDVRDLSAQVDLVHEDVEDLLNLVRYMVLEARMKG